MAAVLVSWIEDAEPISVAEVKAQARILSGAEDALIADIIIPAARQLAETRTGAAIRKGIYRETVKAFPNGDLTLGKGRAFEVVSFTCAAAIVPSSDYELLQLGNDSVLGRTNTWPAGGPVAIEYKAGVDLADFPTVKQWMLLACAWAFEQRELFAHGQQAFAEMPSSYVDALLAPLQVPPRF
jgi:uncharacterized phiE125 gp8 family phage protein